MSSYHTDCHVCGRRKWHDAIPGQEIRSYCPTCEPLPKRTAFDDLPPPGQGLKTKGKMGRLPTVESKSRLPVKAEVGEMFVVVDEHMVYCYMDPNIGWRSVGSSAELAEAIDAPETKVKKAKDKKNNRRAAIEATRRKQAERERASREG